MKTETWYYCDRGCGYRTQDRDEMKKHERGCRFEHLPLWQVAVFLDIRREPELHTEKYSVDVSDIKERDEYLSRDAELEYAFTGAYYFVRRFVRTEAETEAALEECKAKMRAFLLHLAGEVDELELKQGENK